MRITRWDGFFAKYQAGKYFEMSSDFPWRGGILIINFLIFRDSRSERYSEILLKCACGFQKPKDAYWANSDGFDCRVIMFLGMFCILVT